MSLVGTGITGLVAAQMGMQTAGHNIANASTPGYNRQTILQSTNIPMFSSAGFVGQGTNVSNILRVYNDFQKQTVLNSETTAAQFRSYSAEIKQIDNMLADPNAGLSPAMQAFFDALEAASANPSSIPARQALLSAGQGMVARFQSIDQRIGDIRSGISQQISAEANSVNSIVQQLNDTNQRIIIAQQAGAALPANDLYDQRDRLVSDLNQVVRITTHTESDGTTNAFFGSGQPLLVGTSGFKLYAAPALDDLTRIEVTLQDINGGFTRIPETLLNGGKLGGLLQFRSETLDLAQNSLGRIATVFAATFNAQHQLGQDLTGAPGGAFFSVPQSGQLVLGSTANSGNAKPELSFDSYPDVTASDYRLSLTSANNLSLLRLSDSVTWRGSGNNQAEAMANLMSQINADQPQGFKLSLSGTGLMSVGDTFLIRPTRYGARDISMVVNDARNIALASPIRTETSVANSGTASISAGEVTNIAAPLTAPVSISYEASSNSLTGFPVGARVEISGKAYSIVSPTTRLPFASGSNISLNGVAVVITGAPADGDTFTINQPLFSPLFGTPTSAGTSVLGSISPTLPLTVVTGENDKFDIVVDGNPAVTVTIAAGVYATPTAIAAQLQTSIKAALTLPTAVTVNLAQDNRIQITSSLLAGSVSLSPVLPQTAGSVISAGTISTTSSLPSSPITLQYKQANVNPALPARLTGFPVGSVVKVTLLDGTTSSFTIRQPTDYVTYTSEASIAFNGIRLSISGAPVDGDTFKISSNPSGVSDNRNALLLGNLQTKNTLAGSTATYQAAFSQLVSQIGNKAREVEVASNAQDTLVKQGQDFIQSASGVNLDEEAANLIRYQQAYQASAKMIDIASKLFAEILALSR